MAVMLSPQTFTKRELGAEIALFERELKRLKAIDVGCKSCWSYRGGQCEKWAVVPPDHIFPVGCDEWTYDDIPF